MILHHIGIVNDAEEKAERFYGEFLGLRKARQYTVPPELSEQLFSIRQEIRAIVYETEGVRVEVFICPESKNPSTEIRHFALHVDDIETFLRRAREFSVEHIVGKTKDKTVHFIRDYSGNLIEIKQRQ
jgi:catechol 2,3-dioxygenase-like lactoylglutathione lyase family enzyme